MKPLTIKPPVSQQSEPQKPTLSIDMAEQIADRAARKAAEETMAKSAEVNRENMESYNRFQQEQQNSQSTQNNGGEEETELFDKATANNITKTVRAYESLQKVFSPPPDPTRQAIDGAISNLLSDFVTNRLGGAGIGNAVPKKQSFIMDVLNTAAAHGFGEQLGANLPQVIQSLTSSIGQKKTQELVDNLNSKMTGSTGSTGSPVAAQDSNSNVEKQKDMVLALDINNPDHISNYASAMGLSMKAARGILQAHQDDIRNERKGNVGNIGSGNVNGTEVTQALTILIQEMTGMKETINTLQNKIVTLEGGKPAGAVVEVDTDSRWNDDGEMIRPSVEVTNRSVNLFQSPIKVDVDDIKGNADPFFHETPVAKPIVSSVPVSPVRVSSVPVNSNTLIEVKGKDGSSSFRMSGEQPTEQLINNNVVDSKKEEPILNNETEVEEKKPEIRTIKKRIVRKDLEQKLLPDEKVAEEHYDINNNLMENKT